jgi:hypothetical protein
MWFRGGSGRVCGSGDCGPRVGWGMWVRVCRSRSGCVGPVVWVWVRVYGSGCVGLGLGLSAESYVRVWGFYPRLPAPKAKLLQVLIEVSRSGPDC